MSGKYGITEGQIYLRADGAKEGCLVVDAKTYSTIDDIIVLCFDQHGIRDCEYLTDSFKLARVRYYLVEKMPSWFPKECL